jgi:hypothetical protein
MATAATANSCQGFVINVLQLRPAAVRGNAQDAQPCVILARSAGVGVAGLKIPCLLLFLAGTCVLNFETPAHRTLCRTFTTSLVQLN